MASSPPRRCKTDGLHPEARAKQLSRQVPRSGRTEEVKGLPPKRRRTRFLGAVEGDKARGAWVDPRLSRITLEDWADRWVRTTVHLKPKTQAGYDSLLRSHVLPAFGRTPLGRIRQVDVREWVSRLSQRGLSPSRTRQAYQVLSALLKAAVESGLLARTPCVGVKLPRLTRREMRFLAADQVTELARVVGAPYDTLIYSLAYGGLRWGEAAALRRGRCQLMRSRLEVVESLAEVDGRLYFGPTKTYQRRSSRSQHSCETRWQRTSLASSGTANP